MLLTLACSFENEPAFKFCCKLLKQLYYPEKQLKKMGDDLFSEISFSTVPNKRLEDKVKAIANRLVSDFVHSDQYGYPILKPGSPWPKVINRLPFPYMERYIKLFMERRYSLSHVQSPPKPEDLFSLEGEKANNSSKNSGNYYHFINVLMCLARLIQYFSSEAKIDRLDLLPETISDYRQVGPTHLSYVFSRSGHLRILKLLLAGFFHDLGKTIIDQRHSIEGEIIILADQTSTSIYQLGMIIKEYGRVDLDLLDGETHFGRDDLTLISKMLFYHDQFGTLGTGEDGYLRLVKIVDFLKMLSLNRFPAFDHQGKQLRWSARTLFDLWLLNIADIIVSIADDERIDSQNDGKNHGKFVCQEIVWSDYDYSFKKIDEFFSQEDGTNRIHDLKIAFRLLYSHFHRESKFKIHVSDNKKIMKEAVDNSRFHTTERLRRLISSSLNVPLKNVIEKSKSERAQRLAAAIKKKIAAMDWVSTIEGSLEVLGTAEQFKTKFSWIGKMDYALGFFEKIAKETLQLIEEELTDCIEIFYDGCNASNLILADSDKLKITHADSKLAEIFKRNQFTSYIERDKIKISFGGENIDRDELSRREKYEIEYDSRKINVTHVNLLPIANTSWIRERTLTDINDTTFLFDLNAQFFLDNYTATIITIIGYILNREKDIDSPKDFQFQYAKDRLDHDKIKKITSMVGPFQTNKSIHYILQNIYIY